VNTMVDEDLHDPRLDAAWARLGLQPELPTAAVRAAIRQTAWAAVAAGPKRNRGKWPFVIGAFAVGAVAAAAMSLHFLHKAPVAASHTAADTAAAAAAAAAPAETPSPARSDPQVATVEPAAAYAPRVAAKGIAAASSLVLLPPGESPFFAVVRAEANARFQTLQNTSDDRTYVAGLLFDHQFHVKDVAAPELLPPPDGGAVQSGLTDSTHFAARAFGLRVRDFDQGVGLSVEAPPAAVGAHPHILVWAYALRDPAALKDESLVRAAVLAHYDQHLPERPASGDVALLTVVMAADGTIDRFNEEYRQAPAGPLTDESFDADRDQRLASLGLSRGQVASMGSMMMFSDELPGGKPGGAVVLSYAWPGSPAQGNGQGKDATEPRGNIDERAAVAMLKALFTTSQLLDNTDGQQPWVILDHEGHALRCGRAPANDPKAPIQMQLMEAFPGIRIENAELGAYKDPATKGRRYEASFYWLGSGSPPLP
jgi:hypothetical protein